MVFRLMYTHAKKHPALIPLFALVGCGCTGAFLYALRVTLRSPEVVWDKRNPQPWSNLSPTYQYKLYNETIDYKNLKKDGPEY